MGASKVLVRVVCFPKYLNPSSSQPSCLCCLFVLFFAKNTCKYIGTRLHIHSPSAVCPWSVARVAHTGVCSHLVHSFINVTPCWHDTGTQTLMPTHKCVHAHISTCTHSLCIHARELHVHRTCALIRSPRGKCASITLPKHTRVHTHRSVCPHVYAGTHICAGKGQGFKWSFSP